MNLYGFTLALTAVLFVFEFQNVLSRRRGLVLDMPEERWEDFTILVPVYGDPRFFTNGESLARWRDQVVLVLEVSNPEMQAFADEAERDGWHVFRTVLTGRLAVPKLLAAALPAVTTKWVVRVDADTVVEDDVARAIEAMRLDGADLCSVKIRVLDPTSIPEKLQATEYDMSMLARHYRPWMTSGACIMATTQALIEIYAVHTFWPIGEDVETGIIARRQKKRVRHLEFEVKTAAPSTWPALIKQRRLWWAGSFRHSVMNFDNAILRNPAWAFYYAGLVWCGVYFRGHGLLSEGRVLLLIETFPIMYVIYAVVTYVSNWQVRSRWFLVFPFYSFAQTLVFPLLGFLRYLRMSIFVFKGTGRYRFSAVPDWFEARRDFSRLAAVSALGSSLVLAVYISV